MSFGLSLACLLHRLIADLPASPVYNQPTVLSSVLGLLLNVHACCKRRLPVPACLLCRWQLGWGIAWVCSTMAASSLGDGTAAVRRAASTTHCAACFLFTFFPPLRQEPQGGEWVGGWLHCGGFASDPGSCLCRHFTDSPDVAFFSRAPPGQLGLGQFVSDECVLKPTPIYGIPTNR